MMMMKAQNPTCMGNWKWAFKLSDGVAAKSVIQHHPDLESNAVCGQSLHVALIHYINM